MNNWTQINEGNVTIVHHSTSSVIQIIVNDMEEYQPGHIRHETNELWLDYAQFDELKKAISKT